MTLNDAIVAATAQLKNSSSTPALDAQVLLAHALERDRTYIIAHARDVLDSENQKQFQQLVAQRIDGAPVAYLTGRQEFWSLPINVTPDTLIPRPETELLVELALEKIPQEKEFQVADIGTGSGAIALAIASERKHSRVVASDSSQEAIRGAQENARQLGIPNIEFTAGSLFEPFVDRKFNLIVSNPPYVPENDPHLLEGDVRFEPRGALAAGPDGLDVIRRLVEDVGRYLLPGGWLLIEHGYDQEASIGELFQQAGFEEIECYRDLAGQPRVTIGRRPL
ncbi:MAG: peptide chain release factor N(5)-glutamine methyltransferase [Acidiferrobacterales bacterium]|nr:peptide chain release factor N(5)-glutamine methyltransferase [Acidiferrobacterales bacterium]